MLRAETAAVVAGALLVALRDGTLAGAGAQSTVGECIDAAGPGTGKFGALSRSKEDDIDRGTDEDQ